MYIELNAFFCFSSASDGRLIFTYSFTQRLIILAQEYNGNRQLLQISWDHSIICYLGVECPSSHFRIVMLVIKHAAVMGWLPFLAARPLTKYLHRWLWTIHHLAIRYQVLQQEINLERWSPASPVQPEQNSSVRIQCHRDGWHDCRRGLVIFENDGSELKQFSMPVSYRVCILERPFCRWLSSTLHPYNRLFYTLINFETKFEIEIEWVYEKRSIQI